MKSAQNRLLAARKCNENENFPLFIFVIDETKKDIKSKIMDIMVGKREVIAVHKNSFMADFPYFSFLFHHIFICVKIKLNAWQIKNDFVKF